MLNFEAKKGDFAKIWQKLGGVQPSQPPGSAAHVIDKFYRRFVYFEDTVTYFDKIVMFSHREKQIDILKFI